MGMRKRGIQVDNLSFSYATKKILNQITFQIAPGTIAALIGPNGSGKTTLLRCMAGLTHPDEGTISYTSKPTRSGNIHPLRRNIGFVAQGQKTAFPFSCFDVVLTGRHAYVPIYLTPSAEDESLAMQALEDVGAGYLQNREYTRISGGERQLVLIARALASSPDFLILDEPTTFLDMKNQVLVLSLIRRLTRERGLTAIMSIHDATHAASYADQILVLGRTEEGTSKIIADGTADEVFQKEIFYQAFGIQVRIIRDDGMIAVVPEWVK